METMERYLRLVVDEGDPDPLAQIRLASLQQAQTVKGADLVAAWRARAAAYPPALTTAMLRANLEFDGVGYAEEMFAARDDLIPLYDLMARVERQILGALLAVNQIYLANPSFKGMDALIATMRWARPISLLACARLSDCRRPREWPRCTASSKTCSGWWRSACPTSTPARIGRASTSGGVCGTRRPPLDPPLG